MASDGIGAPSFPVASTSAGDFTDSVAWSAQTEVSASEIIEKQSLVNAGLDDAVAERYLRIVHRDIMIMQESLKGLIARVSSVQQECSKAEAENVTLQQYIDSVTKSLAAKS